jgi:hypothetical protein
MIKAFQRHNGSLTRRSGPIRELNLKQLRERKHFDTDQEQNQLTILIQKKKQIKDKQTNKKENKTDSRKKVDYGKLKIQTTKQPTIYL